MGKSIIIGSEFNRNIGSVTYLRKTPLTGIEIKAPSSILGAFCQCMVSYTPADSIQRKEGVKWEITSGQDYASIDPVTGFLEIKPDFSFCKVVVKATSEANPELVSTKIILVTYKDSEYINAMPTDIIFDPYRGYTDRQIVLDTYPKDLDITISCPSPFFCTKKDASHLIVGIKSSEVPEDQDRVEGQLQLTGESYSIKINLKYERQS